MTKGNNAPYTGTALPSERETGWATSHTNVYHYYEEGKPICKRFIPGVLYYTASPEDSKKCGFCKRLVERKEGERNVHG